jgi:hypothetical protein
VTGINRDLAVSAAIGPRLATAMTLVLENVAGRNVVTPFLSSTMARLFFAAPISIAIVFTRIRGTDQDD